MLAVFDDQAEKGRRGADRSRRQARWETAEGGVGPKHVTEGKESSQREDVIAGVMMRESEGEEAVHA